MCKRKFLNRFLVTFLLLVVSLSTISAWAFLPSSNGSSQTAIEPLEVTQMPEESLPPTCSTETQPDLKTASESLKSLETNSRVYKDEDVKAIIDEVLTTIDEVIVAEEANIEDNKMIAEIVESYDNDVKKLYNDINKPHFAVGLSLGYQYKTIISPGIDFQMRSGDWIMSLGVSYDADVTKDWNDFINVTPDKIRARVGILYEF